MEWGVGGLEEGSWGILGWAGGVRRGLKGGGGEERGVGYILGRG